MAFLKRLARALSFTDDRRTSADWQRVWDARAAALEALRGSAEPGVYHSPVPLDRGGDADVLAFRGHVPGVTYVTADLTGAEDAPVRQLPNAGGKYELMVCTREPAD